MQKFVSHPMGVYFKNTPDNFTAAKHFPHQITLNSYPHVIKILSKPFFGNFDLLFLLRKTMDDKKWKEYIYTGGLNQHQIDSLKSKNDGTNPFRYNHKEVISLQGIFKIPPGRGSWRLSKNFLYAKRTHFVGQVCKKTTYKEFLWDYCG